MCARACQCVNTFFSFFLFVVVCCCCDLFCFESLKHNSTPYEPEKSNSECKQQIFSTINESGCNALNSYSRTRLDQGKAGSQARISRSKDEDLQAGSLFVGCLTSKQQASVSQGRVCTDNFTCGHTEMEVADQTFYLTQSHYTDTGSTSPSPDPI